MSDLNEPMVPLSALKSLRDVATNCGGSVSGYAVDILIERYTPHPGGLLGKWATHPEHGRVLIISDKPYRAGKVSITFLDPGQYDGSGVEEVKFDELTLEEPVCPEFLESEEGYRSVSGTVIIRTVEELVALDPYDVIAYKSPEGYDLVCTAYDATTGHADYTLPVAIVCSHSTTVSALRALNKKKP